MMKKRYAVMMTAAMLTGIMTATALAEGPEMGSGMQISGPQMPGSGEMGQAPQMSENGQAPQMSENGQAPQMNGMGPNDNFGFIAFETFVEDGTISQETYEAITKFMEENKPELPEGATEGERPELPEGMTEGEGLDLLKDLLEGGVITQEEYDALAAAREASRPAAPAESQSASGTQTQTADETTGA